MRKNGVVINTDDNLTPAECKKRIEKNKKLYGLKESFIDTIRLPRFDVSSSSVKVLTLEQIVYSSRTKFSTIDKIHHLQLLMDALI